MASAIGTEVFEVTAAILNALTLSTQVEIFWALVLYAAPIRAQVVVELVEAVLGMAEAIGAKIESLLAADSLASACWLESEVDLVVYLRHLALVPHLPIPLDLSILSVPEGARLGRLRVLEADAVAVSTAPYAAF